MRQVFTLLVFSYLVFICAAQNNLPPVYEITTDTALQVTIPDSYWQMLEDKGGRLSFEDVSRPPGVDQFHYNINAENKSNPSATFWFRYVLKNVMNHDARICFPTYGEQSDFYIISTNDKITHQVNGVFAEWSKLNGLKFSRYLPITIKPKEEVIVYNRAFNHILPLSVLSVSFSSTEKIIQDNYIDNEMHYFTTVNDSFIFGALLFASLFIFFFFAIVREKVYLYFSLYLFFLGFGRFNIDNEFYYVFLREYPVVYFVLSHKLIWFFAVFFQVHFIRYLLNTPRHFPRWDKFLFVLSSIYAFLYLLYFILDFYPSIRIKLGSIPGTIILSTWAFISATILATFLLIVVNKIKVNRLLIIVVLPTLMAWSISNSLGILYKSYGWTFFFPHFIVWLTRNWFLIETILLSLLVVFFSWVLLHRFIELKKEIIQKELEKEIEKSQLIAQQKVELEQQVTERTAELKQSLEELKTTQAQLIQSEKMASLGELTAGIAHEIQNPLNFVNNFSEVNVELVDELKGERLKAKGERNEKMEDEILNDVKQNLEKILQHGKRADAIVKGMLQHSRASTGKAEPTDINALADEYLRLSYHGLRAKDKEFNVTLNTDFDAAIGKINVVPQDIGRVLLNLFNNAFYAVTEKKKQQDENYEPTVSISTKKISNKIEIKVWDNGLGIPQKVVDKIFQPFFTTKPTGQGTGLGLSLSYDIVKVHGGEIKVETKEGESSAFIIQLPLNEILNKLNGL